MKHLYIIFRGLLVLLLSCIMAGSALAQVSISIQVLPPYRYRVADYSSHPEQILVTVLNTTTTTQRLQLRGAITGDNGIEMRVKPNFKSKSALVLAAGEVRILNGGDFPSFLELDDINYIGISQAEAIRGNGLPEGNYRLCVQAFNYDTNVALSANEPTGCSNMFSVTHLSTPDILTPANQRVVANNGTQLLTLSWTTPPGAPPSIAYRIRIAEMLGNSGPNDALMLPGRPILFEKEVMTNMYIYNPGDPQLTPGRRYAMRVTAFDPNNSVNFRNKGRSDAISFTYGEAMTAVTTTTTTTAGASVTPDVGPKVTPIEAVLKGSVEFAFASTEEKDESGSLPLVGAVAAAESVTYETLGSVAAGQTRYPLPKAQITVYGRKGPSGEVFTLGTGVSGTNGAYSLNINNSIADNCTEMYMVVNHSDNQLYPVTRILKLQKGINGYSTDLGATTLTVRSMRVKPFVLSNTAYSNGQVSVNILLNADKYNASPLMKAAGLGATGEKVNFNNVNYIVLAKLTSANSYKRLFSSTVADDYLVQVAGSNKPSVYYPLGAITPQSATDTAKIFAMVAKNFVYNPSSNEVEGIVSFNGTPYSGTRILATVNADDIVDNSTTTTFEAVSDLSGYYKFANLPTLKKNAVITLNAIERSIQDTPIPYKVTNTGALLLTQNILLTKWVATIVGKVVQPGTTQGLANVLVTVEGTNLSTRTTSDGNYIFKVPYDHKGKIVFTADGYLTKTEELLIAYNRYGQALKDRTFNARQWSDEMGSLISLAYLNPNTRALSLGIGPNTLDDAYSKYFSAGEELRRIYEPSAKTELVRPDAGAETVLFILDNKKVAAKVWVDGVRMHDAEADKGWVYTGKPGNHQFTVEPLSSDQAFFKVSGDFQVINRHFNDGGYEGTRVYLQRAVFISGVVRDQKTGAGLDSAEVAIAGLPYKVFTNSKGEYQLIVPDNREYTVVVTRPAYEGATEIKATSGSQKVDFPVAWIDPSFPILKTLAGYPVTISKITKISEGNFMISGAVTVASNALYTIDAAKSKLTFTDIAIKAEAKDINAIPVADINFEQAVLPVKAFGFASVEVQGAPFIQLRGLRPGDYTNAVIGGNQLVMKLSTTAASDNLPVLLPDAAIKDAALTNDIFNYVFSTTDKPITELSNTREFKMQFADNADLSQVVSFAPSATVTYLEKNVGVMGSLFVNKSTATLSSAGYGIDSYYQFPDVGGLTIANAGNKIALARMVMKPGSSAQVINLPASNEVPFTGTMQKFRLAINKMQIVGLGSANANLSMAGKVMVIDKSVNSKDDNGVLTIRSLSLTRKADGGGTSLTAVLKLPSSGLTIRSLNFTTPKSNNELSMSYNFEENSFALDGSGELRYTSSGSSAKDVSSVIGSIFPVTINKFRLRSKDWDMYLVASPNTEVDLKVVKIKISKVLVNVGFGMSIADMNNDLIGAISKTPAVAAPSTPSTTQVDEAKSSWAIGIIGGVTMPFDGLSVSADASLVLGNIDGKMQVAINSFDIAMKNPAYSMSAKVKMAFNDDRQGFEAKAELTTLTKKFDAYFKYYSLSSGGYELAASITGGVKAVTGPIMWHSIGGGFTYYPQWGVIGLNFNGDISPVGVPKNATYVKATVGVLFDTDDCGAKPVITGTGILIMKDREWGTMEMKADFCKQLLLVTVRSEVDVVDNIRAQIAGVLYGMGPQAGADNGAFFLGVTGRMINNSWTDLFKGNMFAAFGYNFSNRTPAPAEAKILFAKVNANSPALDNGVMNGIYLTMEMGIPDSYGSFRFGKGDIASFNFTYDFQNSGGAELAYNYTTQKFYAESICKAKYDVFIDISYFRIGARASYNMALAGGHADGNWFLKGKADFNMEFYNDYGAGCNSAGAKFCDPPSICPCFDWWGFIPYPNGKFNCSCGSGWIPCGIRFKICVGMGAEYKVSSGGSSINVTLN